MARVFDEATRASLLLKLGAMSLYAILAGQGCATPSSSSNLGQAGVSAASQGLVVQIYSMSMSQGPTRRISAKLVVTNEGEQPVDIAAKDIVLLDTDGQSAASLGEGPPIEPRSTASGSKPTPGWLTGVRIVTAPLVVLKCLYLLPLCAAQVIGSAVQAVATPSTDRGSEVVSAQSWQNLHLAPGEQTAVWVSFHEGNVSFDKLSVIRVSLPGARQVVELPLRN